jgi:hypothetical protein
VAFDPPGCHIHFNQRYESSIRAPCIRAAYAGFRETPYIRAWLTVEGQHAGHHDIAPGASEKNRAFLIRLPFQNRHDEDKRSNASSKRIAVKGCYLSTSLVPWDWCLIHHPCALAQARSSRSQANRQPRPIGIGSDVAWLHF